MAHTSVDSTPSLAPTPGVTPPRPEGQTHKFLSDALVSRGFVTQRAMDAALQASRSGRRYSEILVANGDLSDDDLARTLADHYRIDHVDLDAFPIDADVAHLMGPDAARRLGALPLALLPTGEVVVAVHDPESMSNMAEIAKRVGREMRPVVVSRSQVERHINGLTETRGASAGQPAGAPAPPAPPAPPAAAPVAPAPAVPANVVPVPAVPAPAAAPAPVAAAAATPPVDTAPAAGDRSHIDEERSRIAERARALAQYRHEMPSIAADPSPTWASAPESEPQARVVGHVTIPPDRQRQAEVAGSEGPATTVRDLERRLADAERRTREAEALARVAEDRARAAEKHAEHMSAAATAANEALAQLAQARLVSDQTARASAREIESLSNELDSERAERRRLESELQRRLWQERSNAETPRLQAPAPAPAPVTEPVAIAPLPAVVDAPAPPAQPVAAQPAQPPQPVAAQPPQPAPQPFAAEPAPAPQFVAAQPAVAAQPVAAQPAVAAQPVAAQPAPVQPVAERRVANHEADSKKVRGLRRMIAALRR